MHTKFLRQKKKRPEDAGSSFSLFLSENYELGAVKATLRTITFSDINTNHISDINGVPLCTKHNTNLHYYELKLSLVRCRLESMSLTYFPAGAERTERLLRT